MSRASVPGRPSTSSAAAFAERGGAGRIAAQILDDAGPHQLHGQRDLLELVFAEELAHDPAGEDPILAQRAPDLREMIGRARPRLRGGRSRFGGPAGGAGVAFRLLPAGAPVGQHAQEGEGQGPG